MEIPDYIKIKFSFFFAVTFCNHLSTDITVVVVWAVGKQILH